MMAMAQPWRHCAFIRGGIEMLADAGGGLAFAGAARSVHLLVNQRLHHAADRAAHFLLREVIIHRSCMPGQALELAGVARAVAAHGHVHAQAKALHKPGVAEIFAGD